MNWEVVASELGVTAGMAYRVAVQGYEPHTNSIRAALGFPVLASVPVCACGEVHLRTRCPRAARPPRKPRRDWKRSALWLAGLLAIQRGLDRGRGRR